MTVHRLDVVWLSYPSEALSSIKTHDHDRRYLLHSMCSARKAAILRHLAHDQVIIDRVTENATRVTSSTVHFRG
jgi:hypothetical protein